MKFELEHQFRFESARFLPELPEGHPCRQMHGHSFIAVLRLVGAKDPKTGWVMDFHEIQKVTKPIIAMLDHKVLNDVKGLTNPTSENICEFIYERLKTQMPLLKQVSIQETPETLCRFPIE